MELNTGVPVPTGGTKKPAGATVQSVPRVITGVVQVVVWFEPARTGIEYFTGSTIIAYSIGGEEYEADYPVGVGICSVDRVTRTTPCDAGPG